MKITYKGVTKDLKYYKGLTWNKDLTPEMVQYNKETGKNAVRGGKITGTFEYWLYWDEKRKTKSGSKDISKIEDKKQDKQKINSVNLTNNIELRNITKIHSTEGYIYKFTLYYNNKSYGQDVLSAKNKNELIDKLYKERIRKFPFLRGKQKPKDSDINKKRLKILKILYYNLFYDTKMLADSLKISTSEAYSHAKWLEDKGLIYGEASSGTGVSTKRGTYRTNSILWEPAYAEERGDDWQIVKDKYYQAKQPKGKKTKSKPTKTISKKYIPKDINIEKNRLEIEKLIKNNKKNIENYNKTADKIKELRVDSYSKNFQEINKLSNKLEKLANNIHNINMKTFDLARKSNIQIQYMKEPKSKKMIYYIEGSKPF